MLSSGRIEVSASRLEHRWVTFAGLMNVNRMDPWSQTCDLTFDRHSVGLFCQPDCAQRSAIGTLEFCGRRRRGGLCQQPHAVKERPTDNHYRASHIASLLSWPFCNATKGPRMAGISAVSLKC